MSLLISCAMYYLYHYYKYTHFLYVYPCGHAAMFGYPRRCQKAHAARQGTNYYYYVHVCTYTTACTCTCAMSTVHV